MVEKIFFQSSLPRAGSTIFQNLIGQHPDFYVTPTSGVLELLYAARGNYTTSPEFRAQDAELMKAGWKSFGHDGLFGFFNGVTDKKYVMDKSRGWGIHYDFLNFFYPDPKIICMIRDPRDIFASMEKKFRSAPERDSGMVNHAQMLGITTESRIDIWASREPVGLAFTRISQMIKEGIDKKVLFVKYENLCHNPHKEMERVYEYLGLPVYSHDFKNIEQITKEDDEVYGIFGDHTIRQELKALKSDAREILGKPACKWIENQYEWFYTKFGYNA